MTRNIISKKYKRNIGLGLLAFALLLVILMCVTVTRTFIIGLLGWAVCVYIPVICFSGVMLCLDKRIKVSGGRLAIYILLFVSILCTLHIGCAKTLINGDLSYITEPFNGYDTAGGMLISLITSPLIAFNNFGAALAVSFVIVAGILLAAIFPLVSKIKDGEFFKKRAKEDKPVRIDVNPLPKDEVLMEAQKERNAAVYADEQKTYAQKVIFEPKQPVDMTADERPFAQFIKSDIKQKAKTDDSSRILFGNEMPAEEQPPQRSDFFSNIPARPTLSRGGTTVYREEPEVNKPNKYDSIPIFSKEAAYYDDARYQRGGAGFANAQTPPISSAYEKRPNAYETEAKPEAPVREAQQTVPVAEPPKQKVIITNPKEYITKPLNPMEYFNMMTANEVPKEVPAEVSGYQQNVGNPAPVYAKPQSAPVYQKANEPVYQKASEPAEPYRQAATHNYQAPVYEAPVSNDFGAAERKTTVYEQRPAYEKPREDYIAPTPASAYTEQTKPAYTPAPKREEPAETQVVRNDNGFKTTTERIEPTRPVAFDETPKKVVQQNIFDPKDSDAVISKPYIKPKPYVAPPLELLKDYPSAGSDFPDDYNSYKERIESTLQEFDIPGEVVDAHRGATFTRYEIVLGAGCNVKKVSGIQENLTMRLEVPSIRILSPIKGKNAVGIEIPNAKRDVVGLKTILSSREFMQGNGGIKIAVGTTLEGTPYVADLAAMSHLLVAGATGTGKSVFINQVIASILYKYSPEDVRLLLIDPKRVELSVYQGLPNLLIKETVKEPQHAVNLLNWLTNEMESRYEFLEEKGVPNIDQYNNFVRDKNTEPKMYRIVLIVDEMADLMMTSGGQIDIPINRIAQKGRACGIHLILATQRPIVKVITGNIKANILARVAFAVKTAQDSRIILDEMGAESLLGKGDLIFSYNSDTVRMQGSLIESDDIRKICNFIRLNNEGTFEDNLAKQITAEPEREIAEDLSGVAGDSASTERDQDFEQLLRKVLSYCISEEKASVSMAQSRFNIGYIKARKIIDALTDRGLIDKGDGAKPRKVLITREEFDETFPDEN